MSIKRQRETLVAARLDKDNYNKFNKVAERAGCTKSDLVRESILFYIRHLERMDNEDIESKYLASLQKSTNRTCSLLAKIALDVSTLAHFMHSSMDQYGKEQFKDAYQNAIKRVKARVNKAEEEIIGTLKDAS